MLEWHEARLVRAATQHIREIVCSRFDRREEFLLQTDMSLLPGRARPLIHGITEILGFVLRSIGRFAMNSNIVVVIGQLCLRARHLDSL